MSLLLSLLLTCWSPSKRPWEDASSTALETVLQSSSYCDKCPQSTYRFCHDLSYSLAFQCSWLCLHEYSWKLHCTQRALDVSFLKQGWIPAAGKEGGSQLKVSLCFPGTCNSLRGQNVSIILASLFCLAPRLCVSRTEVGLCVTLGKKEGTNLLLNFPHKLVLQEKI